MKLLLAVLSTFAIAVAESGPGGYSGGGGGGPFSSGGAFNFGSGGYGGFASGGSSNFSPDGPTSGYQGAAGAPGSAAGSAQGAEAQGPQVFKYVSIHTAPEDPEDQQTKTVRVPGGNNKHVNIIFVKAPSNGADQKTEVILPEGDEHKNLVYVLVQKTDPTANLNIRQPQPTKPPKPEVYFIRYKNAEGGQNGSGADGSAGIPSPAYGSPSPSFASPSPAYGVP